MPKRKFENIDASHCVVMKLDEKEEENFQGKLTKIFSLFTYYHHLGD